MGPRPETGLPVTIPPALGLRLIAVSLTEAGRRTQITVYQAPCSAVRPVRQRPGNRSSNCWQERTDYDSVDGGQTKWDPAQSVHSGFSPRGLIRRAI